MPDRNRKNVGHSKQANDQGSRPTSARAGRRSTPVPSTSSQPTADPRFGDQSITDPRYVRQPTPNQDRITNPYRGRPIVEATSSGPLVPYPSSQPTVGPYFGGQSIIDARYGGQATPNQQRTTGAHRRQRSLVPQPTRYPRPSDQPTSNQQHTASSYHDQPILGATSSGHTVPYSSSQPTVYPYLDDLSITDPRYGGQTTPNQQHTAGPYRGQPILEASSSGQRAPVPQPDPYPWFSLQTTPYHQHAAGPYRGQPILEASSSGLHAPAPHPWLSVQGAPNQQHITGPYLGGQHILKPPSYGQSVPHSSGQPIIDGVYTIFNVHHNRLVYLEDADDHSPLRGHHRPEIRSALWRVIYYGNDQYSIENVHYSRYAYSGPRATLKAFVEGYSEDQLWHIQATATEGYTIATTDTRNLWMLPDEAPGTPLELSKLHADPRCWWTFNRAETAASVDDNPTTKLALSDPKLLPAPSGGGPMPEAAIVEFTSALTEATDLLPPLRAACGALRAVLQMTNGIGHSNKRLKFHLATVENDIAKLEEDQQIDKTTPALNRDVRNSLETYARELKELHELLLDNQPRTIADNTLKIDEAFKGYMTALHLFAVIAVSQTRQPAQFPRESEKAHPIAEKAFPNRPNAYGIQHRECLQGTREKTLPAISEWIDDKETENWILFFLDVAGSGKSTVAKHMAEKWKQEERLLARFFFSRDTTETMSTNSFCSTVANAFAVLDPGFKKHVEEFTKRPDLGLLSFEELFEGLVVRPLRAIRRHAILIIDALDECHPKHRDQLLQTLRDKHSAIPFLRILATGRPERDIKGWAEEKFGFGYVNFIQLEKSDKDVEIYIKNRLQDLPIAQNRLYPVIRRAEGLFIWARIACDLLLDSDDIDGLLEELGKEVSLDYLYKVALEQSMPKEGASRRAMVLVLQMILAAKEPLSIAELEMLSPKHSVVEKVVTRLSSVLLYQGREDPIRLLHATFREFLTARSKADIFFIQTELGHHILASGCLTSISEQVKQDDSTLRKLDAISERKEILIEQDTC